MELIDRVTAIVEEVRNDFAPDPRRTVFEVTVSVDPARVSLAGATSEPKAAEALHRRIALLDTGLEVLDAVQRLPCLPDGAPAHAIVTSAAAPMLSGPLVSDANVSQVLMGHRLLVLRHVGRWLHCRSTDGYIGWVHRGYVRQVDESEAREWELGAGGEACFSLGAQVRDEHEEVIARLPWGCRFVRREGEALLPNGLRGRLEGEWVPLAEQSQRFPPVGEAMIATAALWLGAPYLWGGTTPGGVDCSGLAVAVYRTHGLSLPRDSDQQARVGEEVDPGGDFSRLRPADLLFFAEEPSRITHVVLSLGGSKIIHSSLGNGGVWRNDLQGSLGYETELRSLFVCARRVVPQVK